MIDARTAPYSLGPLPILAGALWAHAVNGWVFSAPNGGTQLAAANLSLTQGDHR